MMNENLTKAYTELVEIRNGLAHAENQAKIEGYMKRLDDCMVYLQTEDEYASWAISLRNAAKRFSSGDNVIDKEYIINYADKLAELIEVKSEQENAGNTYSHIREDAKAVCESIASTVQLGFQATRERVKEEGPRYVADAADTIRGFGQKLGASLRKWMNEDESAAEKDSEPDENGPENNAEGGEGDSEE